MAFKIIHNIKSELAEQNNINNFPGVDAIDNPILTYDFIIDNDEKYSNLDQFQKTVYDWCCDDNNKNILYKKNGLIYFYSAYLQFWS